LDWRELRADRRVDLPPSPSLSMGPEAVEKLTNLVLLHAIKQGARRIALGSAPSPAFRGLARSRR
jgi:hypothetical protein